jgi:hypothetical protein
MNRYGLGAVVVLAAGVSVWLFGTALWGQVPAKPPVNTPLHSIKITLYEDEKGVCRLAPIIPGLAGFYHGDWVVWNVENGCVKSEATVTVGEFTRVGGGSLPRPLFIGAQKPDPIKVGPKSRNHAVSRVNPDLEKDKEPLEAEYTVTTSTEPSSPIKGIAYFCHEPPCPPQK